MTKTVLLVLFDFDGSVFHGYEAEVMNETSDEITVKVPDQETDYLETYSKINGQCLYSPFLLHPQYVMMAAQKPLKNSFALLPKSWWQT